jgi:uncharacterized membrane protein YphA (DoxX/SURF4 family)
MSATIIARLIVGVLFIFSGLVKANDPLGLSYKMQEFFEVWNWHAWNNYSLLFSILMIAFEIIAGVAVLLNWQMRLISWLLLLLILFFTFLTGYALFSGKIRACGCFGDCIPLTAKQSFIKDLILLVLILYIFRYRNSMKPFTKPIVSISLLLLTVVFSFGMQQYVLVHLPIVDCLPYKVGANISEKMKIPPGAIPDSTVITFVYKKQGKEIEFTADRFPEDFDDSLFQFVKRYDRLVRAGNAEPPIKDFSLATVNNYDSTAELLSYTGYSIFLFVKGAIENTEHWSADLASIRTNIIARKKIPFYVVSNQAEQVDQFFSKKSESLNTTILKCDFVAIKTAARTNPTLYLLKQGTIIDKWGYKDFDKAYQLLEKL